MIYIKSLQTNRKLMIYDEPDSSLDGELKEIIIKDLLQNGKTNIVISHTMTKLLDKFDEIWSLEDGRLERFKTYEEYKNFSIGY